VRALSLGCLVVAQPGRQQLLQRLNSLLSGFGSEGVRECGVKQLRCAAVSSSLRPWDSRPCRVSTACFGVRASEWVQGSGLIEGCAAVSSSLSPWDSRPCRVSTACVGLGFKVCLGLGLWGYDSGFRGSGFRVRGCLVVAQPLGQQAL